MGCYTFGICREKALALKAKHGVEFFVETGTLVGHTAQWAAGHFTHVVTVDEYRDPRADEILKPLANVWQVTMDSAEYLEKTPTCGATMFWLDAHTNESCALMREIAAVNKSEFRNVVLVDDVNQMGVLKNWPTRDEVVRALEDGGRRTVSEFEDVLIAEPCP